MVYRHSVFYSPLIATISGGFLKDEGLDAAYFQKPPQRSQYEMFRQGEIHIMQAAVSTSWDPLSKGIRDIPVHFAQINQRDGFFLTRRTDGSPFDMEGPRRCSSRCGSCPAAICDAEIWTALKGCGSRAEFSSSMRDLPRQWKRPSATDKAISFICRARCLNSWKKTASAKWLRPSAMLFRPSHSAV